MPESDHLTLLNVYKQWQSKGYSQKWCTANFLYGKALKRVREVNQQLLDILKNIFQRNSGKLEIEGFSNLNSMQNKYLKTNHANWDLIRKAICAAYFHNAAKTKGILFNFFFKQQFLIV